MVTPWFFYALLLFSFVNHVVPATVSTQNLLGCGPIARPSRIYPYSPANYDFNGNTPDVCMQACSAAGFAYASVSAGRLCLCGMSSANITLLNSTSTTLCQVVLCTGDSNLYCGDTDYELVYTSIGIIDSVSISFASAGSPMSLSVNQVYQFTIGYQGAVSQINYQIDFGDGTKTGWFSGTMNTTTTVSHVFTRTGQFAVTVAARSIPLMKPSLSAIAVKVADQVTNVDVSLNCPNVTATMKTVSCVLTTVRGTDLTAQLAYNTTTVTNIINNIPNAQYYAFGSPSMTYMPTLDPSAVLLGISDIAILPQSSFTVAGRITSIQFYTASAGSGTIYLLRRICASPQMYCYSSNTCGSCATPYTLTCSTNQYSTATQSCVNGTVIQRFQASIYNGAQFQVVAQWSFNSTGPGYNQIIANSSATLVNTTAMVGDFLGFMSTVMGKERTVDGTVDYRCVIPSISSSQFGCTIGNISTNSSTYRYLLQATMVQPIQIAPTIKYYDPGNFNIQGTIIQRNVSTFSTSTVLPVVLGINSVEIIGPSSGNVNVMITFIAKLNPSNASATMYMWSINGNTTTNTSSNTFNVSFTQTATYTIGCQAQNLLSQKSNTTTIIIQDIITNFSLFAGNMTNASTSQPLQVAQFQLRMATGSNYMCRVNFDTTQSTTQVYYYTFGYIPGSYLSYQYIQPGAYDVYATCENGVSNVSYSFTHYVQHPILGLQLQQRGTIKNNNYRLNFTIAQGTSPQFLIRFNGTQVSYTFYPQYGLVQTDLISGQSVASNFSIEIFAWNYLSSMYLADTFSVLSPIVNPQIRASTTSATFPGPISFEYTMDSGSNVNVIFSFGDSLTDNAVTCPNPGDFPTNQWTQCSGTTHTFLIPGTITIIASFTNSIGTIYKYLTVTLITPVTPIEVRTTLQLSSGPCSAAFVENRAIASFIIQGSNTTVKPAANSEVMIFPDIINRPTFSQGPFQLTMNYFSTPAMTTSGLNVMYSSTGNFTARFEVSNSLGATNISCVVQVTTILQQIFYSLTPRHWPLNSSTPFQASVFVGDANPGRVDITWDFGDGTVFSGVRNATDFNQADTRSHRYTTVGTYTLTITLQGPNNNVTRTFSVAVENPVRTFSVSLSGPSPSPNQIIYANSPVMVGFSIQDTSSPAASNTLLLIDYNDTSPLAVNSVVNTTVPFNGTYTFNAPGIFSVNITMYNRVSSVTQIVSISINAPFNNYATSLCYLLPGLTDRLSETCNLQLSGGFYFIPKQSQLVLYATWSNPTGVPQTFDVQFRMGTSPVFNQTLTRSQVTDVSQLLGTTNGLQMFRLVINVETNILLPDGSYSVAVAVRNPMFSSSAFLPIYILSSVAGLSINDNNVLVGMNVSKTFYANYEYFSSMSCLYIRYSDNAFECYGYAPSCQILPSDIRSILPSCPLPIQPFTLNSSSVVFTRAFNVSRAWLNAYAWNSITAVTAQAYFSFPLSTSNCGVPRIEFDISSPLIRSARRIQRSRAFSIAARTVLNCSQSLNNTKQWTLLQCDTSTERCVQTEALNQFIAQLSSAQTAEITIRARALPLGTYMFNYSVTMNALDAFSTFDYTYIQIVPSDIKVNLLANGTSVITNGITQSLLFQPGVYSTDPDSTYFNPQEWMFQYFCRIYGVASYPMFDGQELTIESTLVDRLNPSCFDSPGNTSYFKYGPNNNQSILYIQPRSLQSFRSYEFKAVITNIYDTTRQYSGFALVQIQDMDSVLIAVECIIKMCSPDLEYQRINPTTQASLTSKCLQCDDANDTIIQWSIYRGFQTGYPNNDIQWVLMSNMSTFDDILFFGRTSRNFTATSDLFVKNPTIFYWKFQSTYIVTTPNGVVTGIGAIRFQINSAPTGGNCTVDRNNGTTTTLFTFSCNNFYDDDGIQDYTFYAYPTVNGSRVPIGFTRVSQFQVYLPRGDPDRQFSLDVVIEVRDTLGAIQSVTLPTLIVRSDDSSIMDFIQLSQQSNTQGQGLGAIEQILYGGDQNLASQIILSLSQALNSMSSDLVQNATTGDIPTQSISVSGLFSSGSGGSSTSNGSSNTSEALSAYNQHLNSQANVRDYAIQFMSNLTLTTVDSIKLQASTISELTSIPTELTRQATLFASTKCEDLINSLNEMVETVSYEDVQMAVNSVAQLASNILVAMNAPLLERGQTLNLDYERANMLPADYETDIETIWSNPNFFADGDDFSAATIEKNRNRYYQQLGSNDITGQVTDSLSKAVNVLNYHMNVGQNNTIVTSSISMITQKLTSESLSSLVIDQPGGAQFSLPRLSFCNATTQSQSCSNSTPVTVNSVLVPLATSGNNGQKDAAINMSRSVTLSLTDTYGTAIPVNNLSDPIVIIIPRDPSLQLPAMTFQNATQIGLSFSTTNNNRQFSLYHVNVIGPSPNITISATFELKSDNPTQSYMLIYRFDGIPILNSTMNQTDGSKVLCPSDQIYTNSDGYLYAYFLDNIQTKDHQYVMFGIREMNSNESSVYCPGGVGSSLLSTPITDQQANFTVDYWIRTYTSGCYYLDDNGNWQSNGVRVGPGTNHEQTECFTSHLTTFAGGWIVLPAPINWNYVFANADFLRNKTIYITLITLVVLYIVFMIYARYKDKKDVEKLGVTPLPDNLSNDKYYYQIIVFTGLRKDAGTTSKVHFIIAGDDDETGTRTFDDPKRKILQRGGIDSFIMAVPKSLGRLNYMRVWHDNSGAGNSASWFLKYIVVRDLQTMEKSHFICQQWLAVEKDDGVVDRLLPVAGELQKTEFAYLLSKKTYHSMSDGHLWFSVFSRPPSTRFTRTQRCTCCFVLLFMSMLMNIMYYDQSKEAKGRTAGGISMGPFFVTPEQIGIGVIVELICFLPSTILVEMFRRLRPRRPPKSPVREALRQMQEDQKRKQQQAVLNDIHPQLTNYVVNSDPIVSPRELDNMRQTLASPLPNNPNQPPRDNNEPTKKKKTKKTLPWWFIFIAYGLSFFIFAISAFFIFARGVEFGDVKVGQWLTSSVAGFFSSVLLTQPVKVIFLAIFFALVMRRDNDDEIIDNDDDDIFLDGDEEYLHAFQDKSLLTFRTKSGHIPLTQGEIAYARDKRLKQIRMWEIIRELIAYSSFLWILYVVSYSNRDPNAFYLTKHLRSDLMNLNNATEDFTKIYRIDQYWDWLSTSFLPRIRATNWYNGAKPANLSGFIGDKTNRILGWATMRQLRVKPESCAILSSFKSIIPSCEASYNIINDEERSFYPGWTSQFNVTQGHWTNYSSAINKAFMYTDSDELDTYTYVGEHATYSAGGYVYEFRGPMSQMIANISLLKQLSWLDMHTRAVIIQMSLYNPNVNLFVFVTILVEFIPTGAAYPSVRVEPLSLLNYYEGFALFKLICSIVYMLFIVYYMQREIRSLLQRRAAYFRDFWSYPEMGIIICSWTGFAVYIWRAREGDRVGDLFKSTNGYAYVNLQLATYVNDLLTFLLGFCCFFGTVKFLRLLRFNQRMSMLSSTLAYAAKDLISFTVMFSIVYLGYLALFFLLFHSKIWACSDALKTAQMLFEMMLLKFDVSDLYAADIFLGPFCFTLFVIFVVFICMNMFISIISDSFRVVRRDISLQHSEHEIINFMVNQFKKWTGLGKTLEIDRLHTNPYDGTHVQYHDPVTSFPDKMDELILALNKIYMDSKRNDTLMFRPLENEEKPVESTKKGILKLTK